MSLEDLAKHEDIVFSVAQRLQDSGRYEHIQVHYEYNIKGQSGECDIIASNNKSIHYYEIKCRTNKKSLNHASNQFRRFLSTHPALNPKFIYITEDTCKRIYMSQEEKDSLTRPRVSQYMSQFLQ